MNINKLYKQGKLPRTKSVIEQIANSAVNQWENMTYQAVPNWWGRQALSKGPGGGGGILSKDIPGGKEVYYANKGKYNYMEILDKGRPRYDMKPALLASSRARQGENGTYIIIAFTRNQDGSKVSPKHNTIVGELKKVGSYLGKNAKGQDVRRNKYKYNKLAEKGTGPNDKHPAYEVQQKVKGGGIQRSYMKFVCLSENSTGWFYPQIMPHRFIEKLNKDIKKAYKSKTMTQALTQDYEEIVSDLIKKSNKNRPKR
jgi:hypothetical protein